MTTLLTFLLIPSVASATQEQALVWADATWHVSTDPAGEAFRFVTWPDGRETHAGEVIRVVVLSRDGDWLHVSPRDSCDNRVYLDPLRLDLIVSADDLAPALTRPTSFTAPDGTGWAFEPGLPIRADVEPAVAVLFGLDLALPVPTDAVGRAWSMDTPPRGDDGPNAIVEASRWTVAGRHVDVPGSTWAFLQEPDVREPLVKHRTCSATILARVPNASAHLVTGRGPYGLISLGHAGNWGYAAKPEGRLRVEPGALLTTPDGHEIGRAAEWAEVFIVGAPRPVDARTCFAVATADAHTSGLTVCAPTGNVHVIPELPPWTWVRSSEVKALKQTPPEPPAGADLAGNSVSCVFTVAVDARGMPKAADASQCPTGYDTQILTSIQSWRWRPLRNHGDRIPFLTQYKITFSSP